MLLTGPLPVAKARLISTPTNLNSIGLSIRKVRMVMRKLKPDQAGRDVHVSSPAPVSGPSGYHRIAESAESHSVPRRSWSGLTATQVGPGQESLPGTPTFWPCAPFYLPLLPSKMQLFPRFCPCFSRHYEPPRALGLARPHGDGTKIRRMAMGWFLADLGLNGSRKSRAN
jgi:hypothetical protein